MNTANARRATASVAMVPLLFVAGVGNAATLITSLPATLSKAGETYMLDRDLAHTGGGAAITATAANVTLDGTGKTVTYCGTQSACQGVMISGASNFTIKNVTLEQNAGAAGAATAIGGTSGDRVLVDSVRFRLIARPTAQTYGVNVRTSVAGSEIRNSAFAISGNDSIESINNAQSAPWKIHDNEWSVVGLTLTSTYARLINVGSGSEYYDNSISIDGASRYVNVFVSWQANAVKILGNTINFASQHGRIFNLDDGSSGFEIRDNNVVVSSQNSGQDTVYVFRLRSDAGHQGSSNHIVSHNTINATGSRAVLAISIGADTYANANNEFSYNRIQGAAVAFHFYGDYAANSRFFCNLVDHNDTAHYPIEVLGALHTGIRMENNEINTSRADGVKIRFLQAQSAPGQFFFGGGAFTSQMAAGSSASTSILLGSASLGAAGCARTAGVTGTQSSTGTPQGPVVPLPPTNLSVE